MKNRRGTRWPCTPWSSRCAAVDFGKRRVGDRSGGGMLTPVLSAELSFDGTRGWAGSTGGRVDAITQGLSLRF